MINKFDIEHMSDDEMDALRASLLADPGTRRLIDEIAQSADESVDIELLGNYVTSMYAQTHEAKQLAAALLREEDIEYIQAMLKHSPEWLESYMKLRAVAESVQHKPMNEPESEPAVIVAKKRWFAGFAGFFPAGRRRIGYALPFAFSACALLIAFITSAPAPDSVPMNSMPALRGTGDLNNRLTPGYYSALEKKDYPAIISTLEGILDTGSPSERIETHIYYAEANIQNAHHSLAGIYHWYDTHSLETAIQACDQALDLIGQNKGILQEQDSGSYTERILFNKAIGYHLMGNDEQTLVLLKKLIDLDGAFKSKALTLQSLAE